MRIIISPAKKMKIDTDLMAIAQMPQFINYLYSNTKIPQQIKDWLTKKGIGFKEFLD
ncbi:hypothetical protein ABIC86_003231 [Paenibacillus sp. DS2363]